MRHDFAFSNNFYFRLLDMEFNLKKILRAMLMSTSEPLSIKDIQAVITRYHEETSQPALVSVEAVETVAASAGTASESAPVWPVVTGVEEAPVPSGQEVMQDLMAQVPTLLTATQIRDAMDAIALDLEAAGDVCRLLQGPTGFRLTVAQEYADWVRLLRDAPKPLRLSQAALETLALIAYRQPITRAEIEAVRGVAIDSALSRLLELELVYVSGRADLPGRPIQYATTVKFLEFCGIRSLEELPATDVVSPGQLSEWIRRAIEPESQQELLSDADVGLPTELTADATQADEQQTPV